ncbi:MAG: heavy metal-responsive transcriptional regulator [Chloroflexi bacterium]|nr:heavy metal-responsive transcriptional regulator [Chloroflexota bacterium]
MSLTISKLAARANLNSDTIRYYERVGLLPKPQRTSSGYRLYEPDQVERLQFIRGAQRLGLRLKEIQELLAVRDRGLCPCGHTEALISRRLAELNAELERLESLKDELLRLAGQFPARACPEGEGRWPCEREFIRIGGKTDGKK